MRFHSRSRDREIDVDEVVTELRRQFTKRYGSGEVRVFFAPGRVNLIGEHVDYNGGVVLPVAIQLGVYVAARARTDRRVRMGSTRFAETRELHLDGIVAARPTRSWIDYPVGVLRLLVDEVALATGCELLFHGTVPSGSGLSSSAALLVATLFATASVAQKSLAPERIAELAFQAETQFVGVKCGRMDQMASALCPSGHALLIDFQRGRCQPIALAAEAMTLLVFDSKTRHQLVSGGFNQRVAESQSALLELRQIYGDVADLGALTVAQVAAARDRLGAVEARRATHVVDEIARVWRCVAALAKGDLTEVGQLLNASHASCRDLYQVSTEHLDALQEAAAKAPGVWGARMTGAGFGGSILALVHKGREADVARAVSESYRRRFGFAPDTLELRASQALGELAV